MKSKSRVRPQRESRRKAIKSSKGSASRAARAPDANSISRQESSLAIALEGFRLDHHRSYTEQVEHALQAAIVRGRLPPGTALSEAAISSVLGISRTPAREALVLLEDEQLVHIYPQVKSIVAPVRRSLIDEGRFVRATLECASHAELVKTITKPQINALVALVAAQKAAAAAGNVETFFKLDEEMHRSMFEFAGRAHVWTLLEGVKRHFDRVRWLLLERVAYHARRAQKEHEAIMDRLIARDAAGLSQAVNHHINAITNHLSELHDRAPQHYFVD